MKVVAEVVRAGLKPLHLEGIAKAILSRFDFNETNDEGSFAVFARDGFELRTGEIEVFQ